MHIDGLTALVTGGSEGIGYAIATELLKEGANVCIVSRSEKKLENARLTLNTGNQLMSLPVDLSREGQIQEAVCKIVAKFGKIDILINSAGTSLRRPTPFEEISIEEYYRVTELNVAGMIMSTQAVLPVMRTYNYGYIINILSTAAYRAMADNSLYAASKYAARAFTEALCEELKGSGIRVSSISPGPTATAIWTHKLTPPSQEKLNAMLKPADVASIAKYMLMQPDYVYMDNITVVPWR